ncbi:MAG: HDIG domain-containing protein [Clostridia bacterium]|nr:HDIG domain-containing protein [Clostridia bacterium]
MTEQKQEPKASSPKRSPRKKGSPSTTRCVLIYLVTTVLLALILVLTSAPKRYTLEAGTVSEHTIAATKDVEDKIATKAAQDRAANAITPIYYIDKTNVQSVLQRLDSALTDLRQVPQYADGIRANEAETELHVFTNQEINDAPTRFNSFSLTRSQTVLLMNMTTEAFDGKARIVKDHVSELLNTGIQSSSSSVDDAVRMITAVFEDEIEDAERRLLDDIGLLKNALEPYWQYDEASTLLARDNAREAVEPVMYKSGQTIVRSGDVINENQLEMIRSLGLLTDDTIDFSIYYGAVLVTLLSMSALLILLRLTWRKLLSDPHKTTVTCVILLISTAIGAASLKLVDSNMAPILLASMLATALLSWRAGLPVLVCSAGLFAGMAAGNGTTSLTQVICLLLMAMISGSLSLMLLWRQSQRMRVLLCGLFNALINALVIIGMSLMTSMDTSSLLDSVLWAAAGALLASVLTIAIQPILETIFNLPTPAKLLELSNPNHPLLRRLLLEAPGTYHHSIIVANLAEAAAEEIGAHPLLARTGAYFHDVGKLARPLYFKENQAEENPLNDLDPYEAAAIVTAHTKDGVALAQKYRLPPEIQHVIAEHHGDTPVMYFYNKALENALPGQEPDIADFRYDGPRPHSKEAAIVMLADTAEAAVRTLKKPTPQAVRERIDQLVRGKLDDGQLSDAPLTMREISGVCEAFAKVLAGVFHERIEYPKTAIPQRSTFVSEENEKKEKPSVVPVPAAPAVQEIPSPSSVFAPAVPAAAPEKKDFGIWGKPPEDLFVEEKPNEDHLAE